MNSQSDALPLTTANNNDIDIKMKNDLNENNDGIKKENESKDSEDASKSVHPLACVEDKIKNETDAEITQLLGSVTQSHLPGTRFSARVIQKLKDQTRPVTPPSEKESKRDEKNFQKTPSTLRPNRVNWSNLERNYFFDALNEFGKDFDAIGNFINLKLKRKSASDICFKTNTQIRQHYYQTYHKICKYVKFSDEVKKQVQELYALINYGEMRRKLQFLTDKHFMKLKNLVYQGHITVRCKGKNIRIKTPSCKALRRLNQLDDNLEDIRLPSKIEVIVSPLNMETYCRVQTMAQNPRVRCTVPLHKKLVNFIKTFEYKWRNTEARLIESEFKVVPSLSSSSSDKTQPTGFSNSEEKVSVSVTNNLPACQEHVMCFLPKPNVPIHRPLLSITEYLSSVNICLSAYEERMGVTIKGETLCHERIVNNKRQRTDSGSEKRSPDTKKLKQTKPSDSASNEVEAEISTTCTKDPSGAEGFTFSKSESSGDEFNDDAIVSEILAEAIKNEKEEITTAETMPKPSCSATVNYGNMQARSKRNNLSNSKIGRTTNSNFKPLLNPEITQTIRKGWTAATAADITIGDLYVVLGQDSKLELEYYWTKTLKIEETTSSMDNSTATDTTTPVFGQRQAGMPYNPSDCDDPEVLKTLSSATVSNKLKHLLLVANLSERLRKRQCSCGHTCERNAVKNKIEREIAAKSLANGSDDSNSVFRQPMNPPRRPMVNTDPVSQLTAFSRQKMSRQVLVQRLLLPRTPNQSRNLFEKRSPSSSGGLLALDDERIISSSTMASSSSSSNLGTGANKNIINDVKIGKSNEPPTTSTITGNTKTLEGNNFNQIEFNSFKDSGTESNDILPSNLSSNANIDESSNASSLFGSMSPSYLLRDSTSNSRWLEENLNDFSLTSLLGHLDEINANRDITNPSSSISVISESSVDFINKFQEITALMQNQEND